MPQVHAPITGLIWKIRVVEGDAVAVEQVVAVIESMKLEIPVEADDDCRVTQVLVAP